MTRPALETYESDLSRQSRAPLLDRLRALGSNSDLPSNRALYESAHRDQPQDGCACSTDIAYGADPRQRLDLYLPAHREAPLRGTIVIIPGGGFIRGDKSDKRNAGLFFTRAGFATLVASYRLAPAHRWPAGAEDVAAVSVWLRTHAAAHSIPLKRVCFLGESAGAAHVSAATLIRRFAAGMAVTPSGVVLVSGVYDPELEYRARPQLGIATPDPRNEQYFGPAPSDYRDRSVLELMDAAPFPLLITYAERDPMQMQVQAGALFAKLVVQRGFDPALYVVPDHNHFSQTLAINTGDESLSARIERFVDALPVS